MITLPSAPVGSRIRPPTAYDRFDSTKRNLWLDALLAKIKHGANPSDSPLASRSPSPLHFALQQDPPIDQNNAKAQLADEKLPQLAARGDVNDGHSEAEQDHKIVEQRQSGTEALVESVSVVECEQLPNDTHAIQLEEVDAKSESLAEADSGLEVDNSQSHSKEILKDLFPAEKEDSDVEIWEVDSASHGEEDDGMEELEEDVAARSDSDSNDVEDDDDEEEDRESSLAFDASYAGHDTDVENQQNLYLEELYDFDLPPASRDAHSPTPPLYNRHSLPLSGVPDVVVDPSLLLEIALHTSRNLQVPVQNVPVIDQHGLYTTQTGTERLADPFSIPDTIISGSSLSYTGLEATLGSNDTFSEELIGEEYDCKFVCLLPTLTRSSRN